MSALRPVPVLATHDYQSCGKPAECTTLHTLSALYGHQVQRIAFKADGASAPVARRHHCSVQHARCLCAGPSGVRVQSDRLLGKMEEGGTHVHNFVSSSFSRLQTGAQGVGSSFGTTIQR